MLAVHLMWHAIVRVDQSTIVPADEFRACEGIAEEFFRPFNPLFKTVCDRSKGSRHVVSDHRKGGIAVDKERWSGDFRP